MYIIILSLLINAVSNNGVYMALIKCPECGKEVSSFAKTCPNCGCPIEKMKTDGIVKIKLPNIELGTVGLFSSRKATITSWDGELLWEGQHGETAIFEIEKPTKVTMDLGKWANPFNGLIERHKKYNCIQDMGMHWKATYRVFEVDVIDSD